MLTKMTKLLQLKALVNATVRTVTSSTNSASNLKVKPSSTQSGSNIKVEPIMRRATEREVNHVTRRVIQQGWHIGPNDFPSMYAQDNNSILYGEINGELAFQLLVIDFPGNHYYAGGQIVIEKFRGYGLAKFAAHYLLESIDATR